MRLIKSINGGIILDPFESLISVKTSEKRQELMEIVKTLADSRPMLEKNYISAKDPNNLKLRKNISANLKLVSNDINKLQFYANSEHFKQK